MPIEEDNIYSKKYACYLTISKLNPERCTFFIFYHGHNQVDVLQLQMGIAGYYIILDLSLHYTYVSYGKFDPYIAYLDELFLMCCLCPRDKAAFL
jgi:hypothetical protein